MEIPESGTEPGTQFTARPFRESSDSQAAGEKITGARADSKRLSKVVQMGSGTLCGSGVSLEHQGFHRPKPTAERKREEPCRPQKAIP